MSSRIVVFGATGDLCKKKLIPSLCVLFKRGLLPPDFSIVGAARTSHTRESWIDSLGPLPEDFQMLLSYAVADLADQSSLHKLNLDSNGNVKVWDDSTYFLSVPPDRYGQAIVNLKAADLVGDPEKSRVVIEKPFGNDLSSAQDLQEIVSTHLREKQVYRIDHYLGKDTVNNILATRFSNTLLEPLWNRNFIDEVQIFATETIGCEGRSQYYETAGAVRDMLQNHMLQILALVAMEPPCKNNAKEIRREKVKALSAARLGTNMVFGQYNGYRNEPGVDVTSDTPTFIAGDIYVDNWRWQGVPFYFMTGKKLPVSCVEVVIKLKSPPLNLFQGHTSNDRIVMRIQPDPHFDIQIDIKSPGLDDKVETAILKHDYPSGAIDGYVRLLYDAISKDQSHFVHSEEVLESWRIVQDLLCTGLCCPMDTRPLMYNPGDWGPDNARRMASWDFPLKLT